MTPRVVRHIESKIVSEEYLSRIDFSMIELQAIANGPTIQTRKNFPQKKSKKRRKKT